MTESKVGIEQFRKVTFKNFEGQCFCQHSKYCRCKRSTIHVICNILYKQRSYLTNQQINSMEQILSWEDDTFQATPEIPRILCNPKCHHPTHKCPQPGPYPQPDQSSPCIPILNMIHFNIILPSTSRSSKGPHSHGCHHKTLYLHI